MTVVELLKHHMPYAKGDIAGIESDAEAKEMIEMGVARLYKPVQTKATVVESPKSKPSK